MTNNQKSKKWVDYSDSDSPDEFSPAESAKSPPRNHHKLTNNSPPPPLKRYVPSRNETNRQLDLLDDLDDRRVEQVWLDIFSQNLDYLQKEIKYLSGRAKKGGNIVKVNSTEDPKKYHLLAYIDLAYDYVKKGYDPDDFLEIKVSDRNFQKSRRDQGSGKEEKNKKYVNKSRSEKIEESQELKPQLKKQNFYQEEESEMKEKMEIKMEKSKKISYKEAPSIKEEKSVSQKQQKKAEKKVEKQKKKKKEVTSKFASKNPFESLEDV